jgi:hypothetical protein
LKQYQFAHFQWPENHSSLEKQEESSFLRDEQAPPSAPPAAAVEDDVVDGSPLVSQIIHRITETQITDKATVLGRFCNEGNNLGDSVDLVVFIVKALNLFDLSTVRLTFPSSWSHLFGPPLQDSTMMF